MRECFFQTVSNSSSAHFGYLVAAGIEGDKTLTKALPRTCTDTYTRPQLPTYPARTLPVSSIQTSVNKERDMSDKLVTLLQFTRFGLVE